MAIGFPTAGWVFMAYRGAKDISDSVELALFELLILVVCGVLMMECLTWFRIELTNEGITKRGLRRMVHIPWEAANERQKGLNIEIRSADAVILLNPFIYPDKIALLEFLAYHLPSEDKVDRPGIVGDSQS